MDLTPQQIKDKLLFLEQGDSYKTFNRNDEEIEEIIVEVTEEFSSSQKDTIRGYIDYLYASSEARTIFNQITEPILIAANTEGFGGQKIPEALLLFDIDVFNSEKYGYISKTGEYVENDLELAFMHELIHAITGKFDTELSNIQGNPSVYSSSEDSLGQTQVIANKIHEELGHPIRASYDGAAFLHEPGEQAEGSIERGTQFTKNKIVDSANSEVDIAVFVSERTFQIYPHLATNYINTSTNRPQTNDLIIHKQLPGADKPANNDRITLGYVDLTLEDNESFNNIVLITRQLHLSTF